MLRPALVSVDCVKGTLRAYRGKQLLGRIEIANWLMYAPLERGMNPEHVEYWRAQFDKPAEDGGGNSPDGTRTAIAA